MIKKANGITLIALVITIIVLLVLSGITLVSLTGDNGLINKSADAKKENDIAQLSDDIEMDLIKLQYNSKRGEIDKEKLKEILNKYFKSVPENLPTGEALLNLELQTVDKYGKHIVKLTNIQCLAQIFEEISEPAIVFGRDNAIVVVPDDIPTWISEKYEEIINELGELRQDFDEMIEYFGTIYTIDGKRYYLDNIEGLSEISLVKTDENADPTKNSHISMSFDTPFTPGEELRVLLGFPNQDGSSVEWIGIEDAIGNADNNGNVEFDVSPELLEKFENGYAYILIFSQY